MFLVTNIDRPPYNILKYMIDKNNPCENFKLSMLNGKK